MAHGVHPNFADKHEEHHRPELQKGLVIKHNANQRYATSGITSLLFKEVGKIHNLPTQAIPLYYFSFCLNYLFVLMQFFIFIFFTVSSFSKIISSNI